MIQDLQFLYNLQVCMQKNAAYFSSKFEKKFISFILFLFIILLSMIQYPCKFDQLQSAAKYLRELQIEALNRQTSGVAGLLVDKKGNLIFADTNRIINKLSSNQHFVKNPMSHGEGQIMKWYWQNKVPLNLPEPHQLTIITTLDPCLMCTSNIVMSGLNVGTITLDDRGGANFGNNNFADFEFAPEFREKLIQHFGYYMVDGEPLRDKYVFGAQNVAFKDQSLPKALQNTISAGFYETAANVCQQIKNIGVSLPSLKNINKLSDTNAIKKGLKEVFPKAMEITLTDKVIVDGKETAFFQPSALLQSLLKSEVNEHQGAKNALAIIDPFGNLLALGSDRFDISPIHTAMHKVLGDLTEYRFRAIDEELQRRPQLSDYSQTQAFVHFPFLVDCTFIFLNELPPKEASTLQTIGIYCFSVFDQLKIGSLLYIFEKKDNNPQTIQSSINFLPSFYKNTLKLKPLKAKISNNQSNSPFQPSK